jgi:hypothetical protein
MSDTPGTEPYLRDTISVGEINLSVKVFYDGTNTLADVSHEDGYGVSRVLATGEARRKKGDPRNQELGEALAVARALSDLADAQVAEVERLLK